MEAKLNSVGFDCPRCRMEVVVEKPDLTFSLKVNDNKTECTVTYDCPFCKAKYDVMVCKE